MMFQVSQKLKLLKTKLKSLNKQDYFDIEWNYFQCKKDLQDLQQALKVHKHRKRVTEIKGHDDKICSTPIDIADAFISYYKKLLGTNVIKRT
ncbi:Protein maternal effect lethal 26, partial [Bienertia sinuspersici]